MGNAHEPRDGEKGGKAQENDEWHRGRNEDGLVLFGSISGRDGPAKMGVSNIFMPRRFGNNKSTSQKHPKSLMFTPSLRLELIIVLFVAIHHPRTTALMARPAS
jgi:hypothetical protein